MGGLSVVMRSTDWEAIELRYKKSKEALDYMRGQPISHEEALKQTQRLKNKNNEVF